MKVALDTHLHLNWCVTLGIKGKELESFWVLLSQKIMKTHSKDKRKISFISWVLDHNFYACTYYPNNLSFSCHSPWFPIRKVSKISILSLRRKPGLWSFWTKLCSIILQLGLPFRKKMHSNFLEGYMKILGETKLMLALLGNILLSNQKSAGKNKPKKKKKTFPLIHHLQLSLL